MIFPPSLPPKLLMSPPQLPKMSASKAKKKKSVFWGIEVAKILKWRDWELGKEMIKHLILKNVHEKTQKLSYRCVGCLFLLCTPHALPASSSLLLHQSHYHLFSEKRNLPPLPLGCVLETPHAQHDRKLLIQMHSPCSWQEYFK